MKRPTLILARHAATETILAGYLEHHPDADAARLRQSIVQAIDALESVAPAAEGVPERVKRAYRRRSVTAAEPELVEASAETATDGFSTPVEPASEAPPLRAKRAYRRRAVPDAEPPAVDEPVGIAVDGASAEPEPEPEPAKRRPLRRPTQDDPPAVGSEPLVEPEPAAQPLSDQAGFDWARHAQGAPVDMIQGFIRSHGGEREAVSGPGPGDDGMATALAQDYPNLDAASLRPGKRKRPSRPRSKRGKNDPSSGG